MKLDLVLCMATAAYAAPIPEDECFYYPIEVRMCVKEELKRTGWKPGFYEQTFADCCRKYGYTREKLAQKNRDCIKEYKKRLTNKN